MSWARGMLQIRVMRSSMSRALLVVSLAALMMPACAAQELDEERGSTESNISVTKSFVAKGTAYYPDSSAMQGGFVDRKGAKLRTLQQFLDGKAEYVSVAMDSNAFPYGQRLRIKELNAK